MAYICSISYALGAPVPIDELDDPGVATELENLRKEGLATARVSSTSATGLAAIAAATTIGALPGVSPHGLVYATETVDSDKPATDVWQLAQDIGLAGVPAMTIGGNACGNLAPAIRVATGMITAEQAGEVLLITADVEHAASRYQPFGTTVTSDGAASCYLTAEPRPNSFRVLGTATRVQADLSPAMRSVGGARTIAKALKGALADLRAGCPEADGFDTFLTGNYGRTTRTFLTGCLGMQSAVGRSEELIGEIGHCSAADLLIALAHWQSAQPRTGGEKLLLLVTSSRSWSLIAVQYVLD